MHVKKQLWSLVRMVLPAVGFALTFMGAYLVSQQTKYALGDSPVYITIVFGLLVMLVWVFWSICHSMKSKMYQRGGREHIQVFTVERPSFFPPSYEESQGNQVCPECVVVVDGVEMVVSLAPPLYNHDSSEAPNCTWSWEQPPRYSQVEHIQQGQMDAEEQTEVLSAY
ncbi:transmembrane protein 252-like [Embiotoca jacksoni]|uniref:transmembrane protein 252-like n=1 Tax=Embiotoca jacksoni TaxID=100190 RepID=UPI003704AB2A